MKKKLICIACPMGCHLEIDVDNDYEVTGNNCPRGAVYGKKELTNPTRILTSTVRIENGIHNRISVKTNEEIPKGQLLSIMDKLENVVLKAPVKVGDVVIKNVCNTGVDIVTTRSM